MVYTRMFEVGGAVAGIVLIGYSAIQIRKCINKRKQSDLTINNTVDAIENKCDLNTDPEEEEFGVHTPLIVESEQDVDTEALIQTEVINKDIVSHDLVVESMELEFDESDDKDKDIFKCYECGEEGPRAWFSKSQQKKMAKNKDYYGKCKDCNDKPNIYRSSSSFHK